MISGAEIQSKSVNWAWPATVGLAAWASLTRGPAVSIRPPHESTTCSEPCSRTLSRVRVHAPRGNRPDRTTTANTQARPNSEMPLRTHGQEGGRAKDVVSECTPEVSWYTAVTAKGSRRLLAANYKSHTLSHGHPVLESSESPFPSLMHDHGPSMIHTHLGCNVPD